MSEHKAKTKPASANRWEFQGGWPPVTELVPLERGPKPRSPIPGYSDSQPVDRHPRREQFERLPRARQSGRSFQMK